MLLKFNRAHYRAGSNTIAKARSKALHLILNCLSHVATVAVGNMAISPCRMLASRSPRRIKQTGLREQHKRLVRGPSLPWKPLRLACFLQRSAQMDRACRGTFLCSPWNWLMKRPINFVRTHSVPITFQFMPVRLWQAVACYFQQLPGCDIKQGRPRGRKLVQ